MDSSLFEVCLVAFVAVMALLSLFAGVIRVVCVLFPEPVRGADAAMKAAIQEAVASAIPGARLLKIEETK